MLTTVMEMSSCQLQRNTHFIYFLRVLLPSGVAFAAVWQSWRQINKLLFLHLSIFPTWCVVPLQLNWGHKCCIVLWRGYSRAFSLTLSYLSFNGCWQRKSTLLPPSGCSSTLQRWILGSKTTDRLHLCKCGLSLEEKLYLSSSRLLLLPLPYTRPRDLRKNENVIFLLTKNTWDPPTLFWEINSLSRTLRTSAAAIVRRAARPVSFVTAAAWPPAPAVSIVVVIPGGSSWGTPLLWFHLIWCWWKRRGGRSG